MLGYSKTDKVEDTNTFCMLCACFLAWSLFFQGFLRILLEQSRIQLAQRMLDGQNGMPILAAGQPSPAKTLLHRGPAQGTCN